VSCYIVTKITLINCSTGEGGWPEENLEYPAWNGF